MNRTIALALTASALIASTATAGTTKLSVAGKTPEQVAQAVWSVAQVSCRKEGVMISMLQAHRACVVATYRAALSRSENPQLAALANTIPSS